MSAHYVSDFFIINQWVLKLGALWGPDNDNILKKLYNLYAIGTTLFVNLFFTTTEFVSFADTYGNEYDLIKNISFALTHLLGAMKVLFFHCYGDNLKKIMMELESPKNRYESCVVHNFHPEIIQRSYKIKGIIYTLAFFSLAHATLISSYYPSVITTISILCNATNSTLTLPEKLPYHCWMPFSYDTPKTYLLALGYQCIPMFSYAYSIIGMDSLFMNIMNGVTMNLEIIQGAFLTLDERIVKEDNEKLRHSFKLNRKLYAEMKNICQHLQSIYRICDDLENMYKMLNLAQSLATLFILCSCLYLVSTTPINSKQFYAEIIYLIAMGFQLILYCYFGNELTIKNSEISLKIWQNDWLLTERNFKTAMLITMTRNKNPLYLTAGKFAPLTLPTFLTIIKASYSFYAVLKSTNK